MQSIVSRLRAALSTPAFERAAREMPVTTEALESRVLLSAPQSLVEFQVNTETLGDQEQPAVALNDSGAGVIVWASEDQDGSGRGIFAQRFDGSGNRIGGEFQVNTTTAGNQSSPAVAVMPDGNFVIVWQTRSGAGDGLDIRAQVYAADGSALGSEVLVNQTLPGDQSAPDVGVDRNGNFIVVWTSTGQDDDGSAIIARRFNGDGTPAGDEFIVNTTTAGPQRSPAVSDSAADGSFIVVWQGPSETSGEDIFLQRLDAGGSRSGAEQVVNMSVIGDQSRPDVVQTSNGRVAVAWESNAPGVSGRTIRLRLFDADGTGFEELELYRDANVDDEAGPVIGMDAGGNIFVTWTGPAVRIFGFENTDDEEVFLAELRADSSLPSGLAINSVGRLPGSAPFQNPSLSAVAVAESGRSLVVWAATGRDGSGSGVYAVGEWPSLRSGPVLMLDRLIDDIQWNPDGGFTTIREQGGERFAQAYTADGRLIGVETRLSSPAPAPSVTLRVEQGIGVFAQRFAADGSLIGGEIEVVSGEDLLVNAAVFIDSDGGFVVVWRNSDLTARAQRFAADGSRLGERLQIADALSPLVERDFEIAFDNAGNFVIVRAIFGRDDGTAGAETRLIAQRYRSDATPTGDPVEVVNFITDTRAGNISPGLAVDLGPSGQVVVSWRPDVLSGDPLTHVRRLFVETPDDVLLTTETELVTLVSNGDAFLQSASVNPFASNAVLVTGDFDGNGLTDSAGLNTDGSWGVQLRTAAGFEFQEWAEWGAESTTWLDIVAGDFDGDGIDDVAARQSDGGWRVGLSARTGFGSELWGRLSVIDGREWSDIHVADFDGDGRDDIATRLIVAASTRLDDSWWVLTSDGTAFTPNRWGKWSSQAAWNDIRFGDFNGDGVTDVSSRTGPGTIWVAVSENGEFRNQNWTRFSPDRTWTDTLSGDFDGDGRIDLISRNERGWWLTATSGGEEFALGFRGRWGGESAWRFFAVGDFNDDGRDDLFGLTESGELWVGLATLDSFDVTHWGTLSAADQPTGVSVGQFA